MARSTSAARKATAASNPRQMTTTQRRGRSAAKEGETLVDQEDTSARVESSPTSEKMAYVEIAVKSEVTVSRSGRAVRTASQMAKGKYVEVDSEDDSLNDPVDDPDDEDFEDDKVEVLSEVAVQDTPKPTFEDDDDIYGEQYPTTYPTETPASKKRKLNHATATPSSLQSKSSTSSGVFTPVDALDTPDTSVSDSFHTKVARGIRSLKRNFEEPIVIDDSDESDFDFQFEISSDDDDDDDDDDLSPVPPNFDVAAGPSVDEVQARRRPRARRSRKPKRFMKGLSQWERTNMHLVTHHPELACIWDELENAPTIQPVAAPQPEGLSLRLLPFQLEGLDWLLKQEQQQRFGGGILADEMGMGKTIQTIALLLAEPRGKPNLVIAPTVALMQWKSEIEQHTNNGLSVCLFYGANRSVTAKELKNYDVVLTTYAVLESVFRKQNSGFKRADGIHKEKSLLHSVEFFRVILDEAHNIKDRACNTAKAAFALQTKRKLCLSGTPLQNRIGELFSLLRFLEADPFSFYFCKKCECKDFHWNFSDKRHCDLCGHKPMDHTCWFNTELLKPIQRFGAQGEGKEAFRKLYILLKRIMLRRTKVERADDLGLPSRVVTIRRDLFNEEEEDLYESIYGDAKRKFNTYVAADVVLNNYANIFQLITRMRQMADHPDLVLKKHQKDGEGTFVCRICDDEAQDAIRSKCHHVFCRMCVTEYIEGSLDQNPVCPACSLVLNIDLSAPALDVVDEDAFKRGSIVNRIDMSTWRSSTKIEALVEELWKLRSRDCTIKSIVFSQFTSFLDLIQWRLSRAGFNTVKLDGHMTPTARAATIKRFSEDPEITVFLVSLKAGGVALNLTEASQVFIMDPWYNPAVEWQSGDRVHRIGQTRPVRITRLVIENSIESRIVELQAKKAQMINATIDYDDTALSQLTPSDLEFLFSS